MNPLKGRCTNYMENTNIEIQKIVDRMYAEYGTDLGILFGIKDREIVELIVSITMKFSLEEEIKSLKKISKETEDNIIF